MGSREVGGIRTPDLNDVADLVIHVPRRIPVLIHHPDQPPHLIIEIPHLLRLRGIGVRLEYVNLIIRARRSPPAAETPGPLATAALLSLRRDSRLRDPARPTAR